MFEAGFLNCPSARVVSNYQSSISLSKVRHGKTSYRIISFEPNGLDDCVSNLLDTDFLVFADFTGHKDLVELDGRAKTYRSG